MVIYPAISKYLFKSFLKSFLVASLIVISILIIGNLFDSIQKFKTSNLSLVYFWQLVVLKLPFLFNEIIPLTSFLATLLFLHYMNSHNELIILLSNGVSIWQFFIPPLIAAALLGILCTIISGPIGVYGLRQYLKIEAKLSNSNGHNFIVSHYGIFFFEKNAENNRIIQTKAIDVKNNKLSDVIILLLDENNKPIKRIDAPLVLLESGQFNIQNARVFTGDASEDIEQIILPTELSTQMLLHRFNKPEMIYFWNMPTTISNFTKLGLPVTSYQGYFYKQLFKPLSMIAMVFLAFLFMNISHGRKTSSFRSLLIGSMSGSFVYVLMEIIVRFLLFSGTPAIIATLLPLAFILLFSNFVILHFQEA